MEEQKPQAEAGSTPTAPQTALSQTNEELGTQAAEAATDAAEVAAGKGKDDKPPKKPSGLKRTLKKINIYLLIFLLLLIIGVIISAVSYLNSKKTPPVPQIESQKLTSDTLKQLANSDATVGNSAQTLTIQGNAIFSGQVLIRSNLDVAGTLTLGGPLNAPSITVSGKSTLSDTQVSTLQVAGESTLQGSLTIEKDLNVTGATSLNGPVVANQITVTKLILSGNAQLQVPNHIAFTGATPGRTVGASTVGSGGSASINGSDTTGSISINTGSGPAAGCFMNVTFNKPFTAIPHVLITPVGTGAALSQYYVTRTVAGFSVCTANAPPAGQAFGFDYFITD